MGSMSYCQFENTCGDFEECVASLEEGTPTALSDEELRYAKRMIGHARDFLNFAGANRARVREALRAEAPAGAPDTRRGRAEERSRLRAAPRRRDGRR